MLKGQGLYLQYFLRVAPLGLGQHSTKRDNSIRQEKEWGRQLYVLFHVATKIPHTCMSYLKRDPATVFQRKVGCMFESVDLKLRT